MPTLYAWAVPSPFSHSPVDHTWITTYDNVAVNLPDIGAVTGAGQHYWYCWGVFHPQPQQPAVSGRQLLNAPANLPLATCLVTPDTLAGKGTIFTYGVEGVCHQLANQVLYAATAGRKPKVTGARGYWASHFIYGDYGLAHAAWARKIAACTGAGVVPPDYPLLGKLNMPQPPAEGGDDFASHAREVLADDPDRFAALLALRQVSQAAAEETTKSLMPPSAAMLNERNQHLLDQAAAILDPAQYEAIFGFEPGERIDLVDPTITERNG